MQHALRKTNIQKSIRNNFCKRSFSTDAKSPSKEDFRSIRGMHDWFPDEKLKYNFITETAKSVASCYGYDEMSTPIMEPLSVFQRTLGDTSDVVMKEMYTLTDLSNHQIALRPEGTAGIIRAFNEKYTVNASFPQKYFYRGPMFRYERPQKGRTRQFHQIGVEMLGLSHPQSDVEVIATACEVLRKLNVLNNVQLEINTLADQESREKYRNVLYEYFSSHSNKLSPDSKKRLSRGSTLRILDSKDPEDQKIVVDAPMFADYYSVESKDRFSQVQETLAKLGNLRLVRGLDYYCHTIFEFVAKEGILGNTKSAFIGNRLKGQQGTVLAGGRYDGLVKMMGGVNDAPGIGWAAGVERLVMMLDPNLLPKSPPKFAIVAVRNKEEARLSETSWEALKLTEQLRRQGICVDYVYEGGTTKQMKKVSNADYVLLIGEEEMKEGTIKVKNMKTAEQSFVKREEIENYCKNKN